MPHTLTKVKGGYRVTSPHGVRAKHSTKSNVQKQLRLLRAIEHNPSFKPRK